MNERAQSGPGRSADDPGATTAQLKADINSGATGDKVGGFDPAASPLGTDDEAGGASPDPAVIAEARVAEQRGRPAAATANAATPELQPNARLTARPAWFLPLLAGVIAAAILGGVLVLALGA